MSMALFLRMRTVAIVLCSLPMVTSFSLPCTGTSMSLHRLNMEESVCLSRRAAITTLASGVVTALGSSSVLAAEPVPIQTAPTRQTPEEVKKQLEEARKKDKSGSSPRWQADLRKAQKQGKEIKKMRKDRNELCEVLGRGC